jgi:FHS family L-fucose permease-like MFS transporter
MVGRFIGSAVMRRIAAGSALATCACGAALLAGTSGVSVGIVAAIAVLAVGLCNSIMFPTIFALAIENLGDETPQGSGILCLAIVGGAVVPVVTGLAADKFGLATSLFVPALCYLWIAAYGLLTRSTILDRKTLAEAA